MQKPKLLDRVRQAIRLKNYSYRTEKAYIHWIKRYIFFHGKRHPAEMGAAEVEAFLTHLAVEGNVAASTQNQALSALLFLYNQVLNQPIGHAASPGFAARLRPCPPPQRPRPEIPSRRM